MMKIVYFLYFVVFCQAISDSPPNNVKAVVHQEENKDLYFVATWDPVQSDAEDPIVGYKVKLFEGKLYVNTETKKDGSKVTEVVTPVAPENPIVEVAEFEVPADKNEYTYRNMKRAVLYQVAVQAYSAKNVGPLSKKAGFSFF